MITTMCMDKERKERSASAYCCNTSAMIADRIRHAQSTGHLYACEQCNSLCGFLYCLMGDGGSIRLARGPVAPLEGQTVEDDERRIFHADAEKVQRASAHKRKHTQSLQAGRQDGLGTKKHNPATETA